MTDCEICQRIKETGWNGGKTHCRQCHRTWTSKIEGHCARCHRHFSGYSAFDAHLDAQARCMDPAAVRDKRGNPVLEQRGGVWRGWLSPEARESFRGRVSKGRKPSEGSSGA